jgi:hypothetical protein
MIIPPPARLVPLFAISLLLSIGGCDGCKHEQPKHAGDDVRTSDLNASSLFNEPRVPAGNSLLEMGRGYDSITSSPKSFCITNREEATPQTIPNTSEGQFAISHETSSSHLASTLHMTADATFGIGVFSGNASGSYFDSKNTSMYAERLLVSNSSWNERTLLKQLPVGLTKDAQVALSQGPEAFRELCGDEYIEGKITGGELTALFTLETNSQDEQSRIHGDFSASATTNSVSASLDQSLNSYSDSKRLDISILRKGPAEDYSNLKPSDLIEAVRTFASKVRAGSGSAWTVWYLVQPYPQLAGKFGRTAKQAAFLDSGAIYLRTLYERRSGVQYILEAGHQADFAPFSAAKAHVELDQIRDEIVRVTEAAKQCSADERQCKDLNPRFPQPLPARADAWTYIDPRTPVTSLAGPLGSDAKIVEGAGLWYAHCDNGFRQQPHQYNDATAITFVNNSNGSEIGGGFKFLIPSGFDVRFKILDSPGSFGDNCVDPPPSGPSQLRIRSSYPLYPSDYQYPPGYKNPGTN